MPIILHALPAGPIETNAYLLTAPETGQAVLIDAPGEIWPEIEPILRAEKCTLAELWITHGHWDHTQGGADVVRRTGAKVRAHRDDQPLIETPGIMKKFMDEDLRLEPIKVDTWVAQGDTFPALGAHAQVEVRHVPGHCPGSVLFYFPREKMAFTGDALFAGSIGRTDLPGGNRRQLDRSIREQIYTLPDDTTILPGHGPETTVGREKTTNPHVRA